jgi:predicted O-linked N-acetylglucosamine transferase (SPINDLY family)
MACYGLMGWSELVADSVEAYQSLAIRLGNDVDYRAACRQRIADKSAGLEGAGEAERELATRIGELFHCTTDPDGRLVVPEVSIA